MQLPPYSTKPDLHTQRLLDPLILKGWHSRQLSAVPEHFVQSLAQGWQAASLLWLITLK